MLLLSSVIAALKTHTILVVPGLPIGGDLVNPGYRCSSCDRRFSASWLCLSIFYKGPVGPYGIVSEESVSRTDEKPALASVGLMGQVASCRPSPPSSRDEVTERPGWQPRGLPDLSNFD